MARRSAAPDASSAPTDIDVFSFSSTAGAVNFTLGTVSSGPMLNAKLELRDAAGNLIASANNSVLGETLSATLPSDGSYRLLVASNGAYGDLGQYTVAGTIGNNPPPPPPVTINAPTNLVAAASSSSQINLSWLDNSGNETNFVVERSVAPRAHGRCARRSARTSRPSATPAWPRTRPTSTGSAAPTGPSTPTTPTSPPRPRRPRWRSRRCRRAFA